MLSRVADLHYAGMARFYYLEGKDEEITLEWIVNPNDGGIVVANE